MDNLSPLQKWYDRHKDKITWGMILYLFGTTQAQQTLIKKSDERATYWEDKYVSHIEAERLAANRALLRRLLDSDTAFILGADAAKNAAMPFGDTGKEDTAP